MATTKIDGSILVQESFSKQTAQVKAEMFGAIATNLSQDYGVKYADFVDATGMRSLRWPGGTLAESGRVSASGDLTLVAEASRPYGYGLEFNGLINPAATTGTYSGLTLVDMIAEAKAHNASLSVIIPTIRYQDDPQLAYQAMTNFLRDLYVNGKYGTNLPELQFDLGNENYDIAGYGKVLASLLAAVQDFRSAHPTVDFDVAVQGMHSGAETLSLISAVKSAQIALGRVNLIAEVDGVRLHNLRHTLADNAAEEDKSGGYWSIRRWLEAVKDTRAAAGLPEKDVEVHYSAFTATSDDVSKGLTAGLPAAQSFLSLFTAMLELGVDSASAWGIAAEGAAATSLSYMTEDGRQVFTPIGALYKMMAQNLIGSRLVSTPDLDQGRETPYNVFAFTNSDASTLYVAANDIAAAGQTVTLTLSGFASIAGAYARVVNTQTGISGQAKVETRAVTLSGGKLTVKLQNDYEIVEIVLVHKAAGFDTSRYASFETLFGDPALALAALYAPLETVNSKGLRTLSFAEVAASFTLDMAANSLTVDGNVLKVNAGTTIIGSSLASSYLGASIAETFTLGAGNDTVDGRGGNDTISAGAGQDLVYGGAGNDLLNGEAGNDGLYGGDGNDKLYGGDGNDLLDGGRGNDRLEGGIGNDTLNGQAGNDSLYGGDGDDLIYGQADNDLLQGGNGNDTLIGGTGLDTLYGGSGDDSLNGNGDNDALYGGAGNDTLDGSGGDDLLDGAAGNDWLYGAAGNDTLDGGKGSDRLYGGTGNDWLYGGEGNDTLYGDDGNDLIEGGLGNDWLYGGKGRDRLDGGLGTDTLSGGADADTFVFANTGTKTRITDFNAAEGDRIEIDLYLQASGMTFSQFLGSASQYGQSIQFNLSSTDRLILENHNLSEVSADWFLL